MHTQVREEVSFTKRRIIVRDKLHSRGKGKRADYVLYARPNQPLALIEAKDGTRSVGDQRIQSMTEFKQIIGRGTRINEDYGKFCFPWVSPKDMKVDYILDSQDHVTELALSETRLPRILRIPHPPSAPVRHANRIRPCGGVKA